MGGNNSAIFGHHHSLTGLDYLTLAGLAAGGFGLAGMGPLAALGSVGSGAGAAGGAALGGAGGLGGGISSLFGPTAAESGLLADIGGGSAIPMFTAGEGLGAGGAGLGAFAPMGADASMASLGGALPDVSPSLLAQIQGLVRPGGPLNNAFNGYQKTQGAMNSMGMNRQQQTAPPLAKPPAGPEPLPSSALFGERTTNPMQTSTSGLVGNAMGMGGAGGINLQALIQLLQQRGMA